LSVRVAVDAMGGDHAPGEIISGALSALSYLKDLHLVLVGQQKAIEKTLAGFTYPQQQVEICHAEEVIQCDDDPGLSIRGKKESSMVKALKMVRSGEADAVLSAGNTGALMAGGVLFLGRLSGISRPACLHQCPVLAVDRYYFWILGRTWMPVPNNFCSMLLWDAFMPNRFSIILNRDWLF
jgi:phosphate acyltransferase